MRRRCAPDDKLSISRYFEQSVNSHTRLGIDFEALSVAQKPVVNTIFADVPFITFGALTRSSGESIPTKAHVEVPRPALRSQY